MTTNPLSQQVIAIIKENPKDKAIEMLIKLSNQIKGKSVKVVHDAALYLMEQEHDWESVRKYAQKWGRKDWAEEFVNRMRKRVKQDDSNPYEDVWRELERLQDRYWMTTSPKRTHRPYEDQPKEKPVPTKQPQNAELPKKDIVRDIQKGKPQEEERKSANRRDSFGRETSHNNILKRIKFNKYVPEKTEQKQQIPPLKNVVQSRKKGPIPITPHKVVEKKPIKIKLSHSKQKRLENDDFQFSIMKEKPKEVQIIYEKLSDDSFNQYSSKPIPSRLQNLPEQAQETLSQGLSMISQKMDFNESIKVKPAPSLFTKQEEGLFDISIEPVSYYQDALRNLGVCEFKYFQRRFDQILN